MRVLIYADQPPLITRASGDVRFSALIKMIASFADVTFCTLPVWIERGQAGDMEVGNSLLELENMGCIVREDFLNLVRNDRFDMVVFEFYDAAFRHLDAVRYHQQTARIVIDSVDLHFRRFLTKAKIDGSAESFLQAAKIKREELTTYKRADSVVLVTPEDVEALKIENPYVHAGLIPNIHTVPPLIDKDCGDPPQLIFVGGFSHAPNIDAVLYFTHDIWPHVKAHLPLAKMMVIGEHPPNEIQQLNGPDFQVLGRVSDISPLLLKADISVAPLRWGGGIKGKVGEAMAYGLPVVTTPVGAEGFNLVPGKHAIVEDDPEAFAEGVVRLARDNELYRTMRRAGHALIQDRFTPEALERKVESYFQEILKLPVRKLEILTSMRLTAAEIWRHHIAWRI
ncbi:MAG: glycosyltransferase family 4 protein [Gammaproteobacteria bacterium]